MGTAQVFSLGFGASTTAPLAGFTGDHDFTGSVLLSFTDTVHLAVIVPNGSNGVGAGFDWWFLNKPALELNKGGSLNFFIGLGGEAKFFFGTNSSIAVLARAPIGLDWKYPKFDIFFQVEPGVGFDITDDETDVGELYANGKIGFRYWFGKKK
jgi:hypothetical protein